MTSRFVVRVTSRSFGRVTDAGVRVLRDAGCEVLHAGPGGPWPEDAMRAYARDADGLIVGADPVTRAVLEAGTRLRVVAKHGAGVDNIDLDAARSRGIAVTYAPGGNARSVAEMTIALLLALWRGLVQSDAAMRARLWQPVVGREASGRQLGIVGLGRIGREVAVLARALGMRVVAYDVVQDRAFAEAHDLRYDTLQHVLQHSDAVSVHVPLTDATRGLIGATALAWMQRDAVLINVARGGVVDEAALARALREGALAGAAVDVYDQEPPWDSPLIGLGNVLLTPHVAHHTREAMERVDVMVAEDVAAVLNAGPARFPVPVGRRETKAD